MVIYYSKIIQHSKWGSVHAALLLYINKHDLLLWSSRFIWLLCLALSGGRNLGYSTCCINKSMLFLCLQYPEYIFYNLRVFREEGSHQDTKQNEVPSLEMLPGGGRHLPWTLAPSYIIVTLNIYSQLVL